MTFALDVTLAEKGVDRFVTGYLLEELLLAALYLLQAFVNVSESLELAVDIVFDLVQHFDRHDAQLFGLLTPQEVQFLNEHFFLFVVLLKLNALLLQPFQDSLDPGQELLTALDLGVKLATEEIAIVYDMGHIVHGQFVDYVVSILARNDQLVVTHLC